MNDLVKQPHNDSGDVIDIAPALRRKKISDCDHKLADVDDDVASLTCRDCGHEIDPWWWLRMFAADHERETRRYDAECRKIEAVQQQHNAWVAKANEDIHRLNDELNHLRNEKNRLWNEQIAGRPLGSIARRRRGKAI